MICLLLFGVRKETRLYESPRAVTRLTVYRPRRVYEGEISPTFNLLEFYPLRYFPKCEKDHVRDKARFPAFPVLGQIQHRTFLKSASHHWLINLKTPSPSWGYLGILEPSSPLPRRSRTSCSVGGSAAGSVPRSYLARKRRTRSCANPPEFPTKQARRSY